MIVGWSKHRTRECKLIRRNKESINTQQIHMLVCCCILVNMVVVDSTHLTNVALALIWFHYLHLFSFCIYLSLSHSISLCLTLCFPRLYLSIFFCFLSHIYCVYFFMYDVLSIWNMSIKPFVCKSVFVYTCVFYLYFLQTKIRRSVEQQCVWLEETI